MIRDRFRQSKQLLEKGKGAHPRWPSRPTLSVIAILLYSVNRHCPTIHLINSNFCPYCQTLQTEIYATSNWSHSATISSNHSTNLLYGYPIIGPWSPLFFERFSTSKIRSPTSRKKEAQLCLCLELYYTQSYFFSPKNLIATLEEFRAALSRPVTIVSLLRCPS